MGYTEFKAELKDIQVKSNGKSRIVLEGSIESLSGKIDGLSKMIYGLVTVSIDSEVVKYNVEINAKTNKPIISYKVEENGVVSEVKPEGEQVEVELEGVPKEKTRTKAKQKEASKETIDEFILAELAPSYEEMPYDFASYVKRLREGETYLKFANELEMNSGQVMEIFDEYRKRIAPLAVKWDEWRKGEESEEK